MAHLLGTTHTDRFTVIDSEGAAILGETFTADQVYAPGGGLFDYTVTELGNGLYQVSYELDLVGTYYLRLTTQTTTPFQVFESQAHTDETEVGATVIEYFTIRDDDGNYYGGSVLTILDAYDPGGGAFAPIIEDLTGGLYVASWPALAAGIYTVRISADLSQVGDDPQLFELERRVLPAVDEGETPFALPNGPSLDDLVERVAITCRDYLPTTVSGDATDGGTWRDDLGLAARSPKYFRGASLFVREATVGDNIGVETRVSESGEPGSALTLTPPLPGQTRRGDEGYLVNLEGVGWPRPFYVGTINMTIADAYPNAVQPAVWTFPEPINAGVPYAVPPEEFTHIWEVSYATSDAQWPTYVPYAEVPDRAGWWWDGFRDRLILNAPYNAAGDGGALTIRGYGRWGRLEDNTDRTGVDSEWLVASCAARIIGSIPGGRRAAESAMHQNRADALRIKMLTLLPANTVQIRS